jgi:hypothetical protein
LRGGVKRGPNSSKAYIFLRALHDIITIALKKKLKILVIWRILVGYLLNIIGKIIMMGV